MTPKTISILRFIHNFDPMDKDGAVHFTRNGEIKINNGFTKLQSDVFISVISKGIDCIILLNMEIIDLNFPVMFHGGKEVFSYIGHTGLLIIGSNA